MFDVDAALEELQEKSEIDIEKETACKWASRAMAAKQLFDSSQELRWYLAASHYRHEACEHAALARDNGITLLAVETATRGIV